MLWTAVTVSIALVAYGVRTWLDFTQRVEQLRQAIAACEAQIEDHTQSLEQVRARSQRVAAEIESVTQECADTEARLQSMREELAELERRLERAAPRHRRVDIDGDKGEL
jgi:chromosome segregation ATPase